MAKQAYHVVPDNINGGWDVIHGGKKDHHAHFDTKEEAIAFGRQVSSDDNADLLVHDEQRAIDWSIEHTDSEVELNVWDDTGPLPQEVTREIEKNKERKGLPPD
jgi:hypothetical protein